MKLTRVEFINYRSFSEDALDIEHDITCLVGINEVGKANALLALEKAEEQVSKLTQAVLAKTFNQVN